MTIPIQYMQKAIIFNLIFSGKDIKKVTEAEYQCTFNQDADFSVQFNGNDLTGIPLRCKA